MYSVVGIAPAQTAVGLTRLAEARLLRGDQGLEFTNGLVRAHSYVGIPSAARKALHGIVANRLLEASPPEHPVSGLEIAWHCTRSGRVEEAIPFLLSGAREAMNRGAPHEAERALTSALPYLFGNRKVDGVLLFAEVLQEQGCWQESLDRLADLGPEYHGERRELTLLSALARLHQSASAAEATYERISDLTDIVKSSPAPLMRVRARKVLAYLLARHRDVKSPASY